MRPRGADKLALLALMTLVLAGLVLQLLTVGLDRYALDDAYIVDHSVAGLLAGHESRFLDSTPWQGVTSPAYVAVVTLLSLVLPIGFAHWGVSAVSTLLLACGWYVLCRRHSLGHLMAAGVVLASLIVGKTWYQLSNGLETGMAMAALTWGLFVFDHKEPPKWGYGLMGLLCFIRPELAAFAGIFVIQVVATRPQGYVKGLLTTLAAFLVPCGMIWALTGTLAPNTLSAKAYFFAEGCLPVPFKAAFVTSALWAFVQDVGLFAVGFGMAAASRLRGAVVTFVFLFILAYFAAFPGALFHNYYRYLYLLVPVAVLGWAACLGHAHRAVRLASAVIGGVVAVSVSVSANSSIRFCLDEARTFSEDNSQMAAWVARHVPKDAVVMVHDAGRISLVGEQPLMDLVGLKSSYSTEVHRRTTFLACQRVPTAISDIARHAGASYMVVTSDWDRVFRLTDSLRFTGWMVERADKERGESHYRVYRILDTSRQAGGAAARVK